MPRKRRIVKVRTQLEISAGLWAWLNDEPVSKDDHEANWEVFMLECGHMNACGGEDKLRDLWKGVREDVLARWAVDHPGTRPQLWWELEAPRQALGTWPGCFFDGKLQEPRKRVGGTGKAPWDAGLNVVPWFHCGLPAYWDSFDADDPPVHESAAAYLRRHGLLEPSEKRRLKPSAFRPEVLFLDEVSVSHFSEEYRKLRAAGKVGRVV
jgi:hypothetical protein